MTPAMMMDEGGRPVLIDRDTGMPISAPEGQQRVVGTNSRLVAEGNLVSQALNLRTGKMEDLYRIPGQTDTFFSDQLGDLVTNGGAELDVNDPNQKGKGGWISQHGGEALTAAGMLAVGGAGLWAPGAMGGAAATGAGIDLGAATGAGGGFEFGGAPWAVPGEGVVGAGGAGLSTVGGGATTGATGGAGLSTVGAGGASTGSSLLSGISKVVGGNMGLGDIKDILSIGSTLYGLFGGDGGAGQANQAATNASNASADAQQRLANISQDQWNYYKTNYQPAETALIKQATEAGSPEEFARARGQANADVTGAYDQARKQTAAGLESYGINPGSPAFQSADASGRLAEASSRVGASTTADQNTRNLAYSKLVDVVGLGRNIPAQSAASAATAANAANSSANVAALRSNSLYNQNQTNARNVGYGLDSLGRVADRWFGAPSVSGLQSQYGASNVYTPNSTPAMPAFDGSLVSGYAKGGRVGLESKPRTMTPHMKVFAEGGDVGLESDGATIDNETGQVVGQGTGTSDSVPAQIDGQQPAALSSGEYVMNAEVPKLTGDEILTAINEAGLKKRGGLESQATDGAPADGGEQAYADGGAVSKYDTKLAPQEEARFRAQFPKWQQGTQDYDLRGAWKAGVKPDAHGHLPDTWKKPNHITFSDDSMYHGVDGNQGGHWEQLQGGKWSFVPGQTNLQSNSPQALQQYFNQYEKGNTLVLPQDSGIAPIPNWKAGQSPGLEAIPNQRATDNPMAGITPMARGGRVNRMQFGLGC